MAHERLHEVTEPAFRHDPFSIEFHRALLADAANAAARADDTAGDEARYVLVRSAPAVPSEEIDELGASAVEVTVLWGTNVLHVSHLAPPRAFSVGHAGAVDFVVPPELASFSRSDIVELRAGVPCVVAPAGAG
ncbi:MAG TPA: hypothetical protein VFZ53_19730, partial [Polyangiaceae bacterium]